MTIARTYTPVPLSAIEALSRETIADAMRRALVSYHLPISEELREIAQLDSLYRARHALVFSIVSPRCKFAKNVAATPTLVDALLANASVGQIENILRSFGIGMAPTKARYLYDAGNVVRMEDASSITRIMLVAIRGVSMKVSAMTMHLFDPTANVYTLDVHMLNGLFGECPNGTWTISDARYRIVESLLIDVHNEHFADFPLFESQWALWNLWKNNSHHEHLAIFGL